LYFLRLFVNPEKREREKRDTDTISVSGIILPQFFGFLQFSNEKHMNNPRARASSAGFLPWCNNWGLIFGAHELEREYSERSDFYPNKWTRVYCNSQKNCCEKNAFKTLDIKWSAQDIKFPDLYINNHNCYSINSLSRIFF